MKNANLHLNKKYLYTHHFSVIPAFSVFGMIYTHQWILLCGESQPIYLIQGIYMPIVSCRNSTTARDSDLFLPHILVYILY